MAEWATVKSREGLTGYLVPFKAYLLTAILGCLLARANIQGIYPFGIAYAAVLFLNGGKGVFPGLVGIFLGLLSVQDFHLAVFHLPVLLLFGVFIPCIREKRYEVLLLSLFIGLFTVITGLAWAFFAEGLTAGKIMFAAAQSILAAGFSVILLYALRHKDNLMKGSFSGEQGMAWLIILSVVLSGLQGVIIKEINLQTVLLGFFILFTADRFGAGSGAGAGAILGFLLRWSFGTENLVDAGIYGLLGFACGGFRKFGKIGISIVYAAVILLVSFFVNETVLTSHLYSSGLGLLFYLLLPGKRTEKLSFKNRVMPEIETTISKVKTLADIFDQLAFGFQAAGLESHKLKTEVPELMNILVERVCKNCSTVNYCWEREFYRTYNFIYDLFVYIEANNEINYKEFPAEWKKYCGHLKELALAVQFILEQQKDREVWQKRLAINREALAEQYKSVSQVIGHLARELHSRHNIEQGKPLVWSRQHKQLLDIGVATFIKTGNAISGDNYNSVPLSPTRNALVVCDGMGVGEEAARISSAALTILEQLLSTGFEPEGAVKALNSILVLRSPEESFVTVDMAVLDLESNTASLIKIGAAPTYIVKRDKVETVKTSSLPAGILNEIEIPVVDIEFREEVLVIVTDGVLDVEKGSAPKDWIKDFLKKTNISSSQELADRIAAEAVRLADGCMEDDGVVLVVKRKDIVRKEL